MRQTVQFDIARIKWAWLWRKQALHVQWKIDVAWMACEPSGLAARNKKPPICCDQRSPILNCDKLWTALSGECLYISFSALHVDSPQRVCSYTLANWKALDANDFRMISNLSGQRATKHGIKHSLSALGSWKMRFYVRNALNAYWKFFALAIELCWFAISIMANDILVRFSFRCMLSPYVRNVHRA